MNWGKSAIDDIKSGAVEPRAELVDRLLHKRSGSALADLIEQMKGALCCYDRLFSDVVALVQLARSRRSRRRALRARRRFEPGVGNLG